MPGRFGPPDSDSDGLYDPDFSCTWYVFGSGGKLMQIYLTDLDIEESENCQHDYIEVSKSRTLILLIEGMILDPCNYSRTSMARILMACLPRLFRAHS